MVQKYLDMAKELGAVNARLIGPDELHFDRRVILKCRWGCDFDGKADTIKCGSRGLSYDECKKAVRAYQSILLLHNHDAGSLSRMILAIERQAFLDGLYLAFGLRTCHACKKCSAKSEKGCAFPHKVRPCDQAFGIDVYKTARGQGLPCAPLQNKDDVQNRYGFVLLD
jgi:predicted metal-binding protein